MDRRTFLASGVLGAGLVGAAVWWEYYDSTNDEYDSFSATLERILFDEANDAVGFYEPNRNSPYLLSVYNRLETGPDSRTNDLFESADLTNWTLVQNDIAGSYTLQDYVRVDGTYWVYDSNDTDTRVWSGPNLTALTYQGVALAGVSDVGSYYDATTETYYLFPEEVPTDGPSGEKIGIWTSQQPDSGFSRVGTAIDATDRPFHVGDADVEEINNTYWMFFDTTDNHPHYGTGLAKSNDLVNWTFIEDDIKNAEGGDLDVITTPDGIVGFSEFTGSGTDGVGLWDIQPISK